MYLIDTMVLSELRRRQRDPGVVAWIARQQHDDLFLSVVSIGEIEVVGPPSIRKKVSEWHQLAASRYSASLSIP